MRFYTARYRYSGEDRLDITVKGEGLKSWFVYLLKCSDNYLYCGVTSEAYKLEYWIKKMPADKKISTLEN
ncbi:MAG: hypothetical protein NDI81_08420 [Desulfobacula sp.]|nr:hypothetical protein [Desulfobacula sp.]